MLETIYVGLSGLMGYSKGLNVISDNVANLNTPGFKSSQLQFLDLFYHYSYSGSPADSQQIGAGLDTGGTSINMKQGELRETGNDLDLAIEGNGFFVLRKDGEVFYTRAGQFEVDDQGFIVDRASKSRLAALSSANGLSDISVAGLRTNAARQTTRLDFNGGLGLSDTVHEITSYTIYDAGGSARQIKLTFTNINATTPGAWTVTVEDGSGTLGTGQIRFTGGVIQPAFDEVSFTLAGSTVVLDFSQDVQTVAGSDSSLQVGSQDGYAAGSLTKTTFDSEGVLTLTYSNGQTREGARLALASFTDPQTLRLEGGNLFVNESGQRVHYGSAGSNVFGRIQAGRVEISNVDLTQQFSNLIITQRGYQASSQVVSAANEMIQQLFELKQRR